MAVQVAPLLAPTRGRATSAPAVSLLSDARLALQRGLGLPIFEVAGMTLLKRLTLVVDDGVITKVFYPVFPPDRSAAEVVAWLRVP